MTYNDANDNDFGILLNSSVGNALSYNQMYENRYNFGADGINRIDISNRVDGKSILYLIKNESEIINSSSDTGTVYCIDCMNITVENLTLTNNVNAIYFYNTANSRILNNSLRDNLCGINIVDSIRNTIESNEIYDNHYYGISLQSSNENEIKNNKIIDNGNYNIYLGESGNNTLIGNNVSNGDNGISLFASTDNHIIANNLSENAAGIYLKYSWSNNILENSVEYSENGIKLDYCIENNFSGNNISHNEIGILYDTYSHGNNTLYNSMINNQKNEEIIISGTVGSPPWSAPRSEERTTDPPTTKTDERRDRDGDSRHPYVLVDEAKTIEEEIESYLKELPPGYVIFNPPEVMNCSQSYIVEAVIPRNYSGNLTQEIEGTGTPKRYNITKVGPQMSARLSGPKFDIDPEEEISQHIIEGDYCKWTWIVTPLENGTQTLLLTIKVIMMRSDSEPEKLRQDTHIRSVEVLSQEVEVEVGLARQSKDFVQNNWQFLLTVIIIPVIGWLAKQKFRAGRN